MKDSKIINGNCWVAWFDILGFRKAVENLPKDAVYELFFAEPFYRRSRLNDIIENTNGVHHKFFSDSFVFYTENDSPDSFRSIKMVSEVFFRTMFLQYKPMRGCLNVGQFYADEEKDIFFGPALIKAYDLAEGQNWIGFVLSKEVEKKCETNNDTSYLDILERERWYLRYKIPYKATFKDSVLSLLLALKRWFNAIFRGTHKGEKKGCLLAYAIRDTFPALNDKRPGGRLFQALDVAKSAAMYCGKINSATDSKTYKDINAKYDNTNKFLLYAYSIKGKNLNKM